ncbi:NAD-dependent epimerase/dehydratase family protein [bacterium]|nr:NAD-dependent epimerase/dehydratase family protein [bacterium]
MRVLVIGGTRFMGPHVVRRLIAMGHGVAVFHRGHTEPDFPHEVLRLHGDRRRLRDHAVEFRTFAPDVVLDMIAVTESDAVEAMEVFTGLAKRFVVASSMDVYRAYGILLGKEDGPLQPVPMDETSKLRTNLYPYRGDEPRADDDPMKRMDDYDKIPIERAVLGEPKLPGTVLRLPMVYGPEDYQYRLFDPLKRMDDARPAILLEEGYAAWRTTRGYVENVAAAIALAVNDDRAAGRTYNVGEEDGLTEKEWLEAIGREAGWSGRVVSVPKEELPESLVADMNTDQDLVCDCSHIRDELGFKAEIDLPEALRRTIEWQRKNHPPRIDESAFNYAEEDKILARLGIG